VRRYEAETIPTLPANLRCTLSTPRRPVVGPASAEHESTLP